jgi:hypothetical protein
VAFWGLFIFFCKVHPIFIYDGDDWLFIANGRRALPMIGYWNPGRVMPETLMPLVSECGVRVLRLFGVDYIDSLMYATGIALCITIMIYLFFFDQLVDKLLGINTYGCLMIFFLLCHFLPYNVGLEDNKHMFFAGNATCTFFYTIPSLISATIVFLIMSGRFPSSLRSLRQKKLGQWLWVIALYLVVFSNMYINIIAIAYIGVECLWSGWKRRLYKKNNIVSAECWKKYLEDNSFSIIIIIFWLISLVYEVNGGRAKHLAWRGSEVGIVDAAKTMFQTLISLNKLFIAGYVMAVALSILIMFICAVRKKWDEIDYRFAEFMIKSYAATLIIITYLILVATKTGPSYLRHNKVLYAVLFYLVLQFTVSFGYIVKKFDIYKMVIPVALYIMLFETVFHSKTFCESYCDASDQPVSVVRALDQNIVKQMRMAEEEGVTETTVYIPYHGSNSWPLPASENMADLISTAMYSHGITTRRIKIHLIADESVDKQFKMIY